MFVSIVLTGEKGAHYKQTNIAVNRKLINFQTWIQGVGEEGRIANVGRVRHVFCAVTRRMLSLIPTRAILIEQENGLALGSDARATPGSP